MPFDGLATCAVCRELSDTLAGGRIDKIYQPEAQEVVLSVRSQGQLYRLLLSISARYARLHLTKRSVETPLTPPMFCMLLRKHFAGSRILEIRQHHFDRIVEIRTEGLSELGDVVEKSIFIEIMGKHSNLIMVDEEGIVIDSLRHVNPLMSSVRSVQPGSVYRLPDHNQKLDPLVFLQEEKENLIETLQRDGAAITEKAFYQVFNGFCPASAREILQRAEESPLHLQEAMESLLNDVTQTSGPYYLYLDESGQPYDFTVTPYASLQGVSNRSYEMLGDLLDDFYSKLDLKDKLSQKSQDLRHLVTTHLERARKKYALQNAQMESAQDRELDRVRGELLTANIYQLEKGLKECELVNYYEEDMPQIKIPLNENLTPAQNAQRYFSRYNKKKRTEEALTEQLIQTEEDITYLESILTSMEMADCEQDIEDIRTELHEAGYIKKARKARKNLAVSKPLSFVTTEGIKGYVGKNNIQNDQLTFKTADPNDEWFHVKDRPGSHVILQVSALELGKDYTEKSIEEAAKVAASHSKTALGERVQVDHTKRRYVRKPAGSKPGFVIYTHQQSLLVEANGN